ncbi:MULTISPECIES: hypothetical protein [unclassified Curtobacterium]|uniref:hypothetical protein n=1 Tax=unclassified Curtobacterium TaxID=257496 RepID=UPI0011145536|nr:MULTISPECIES: hypothetical protein [unclassified Curtobacterium]WIA97518.1 hypothetical protein QOL16_03745 [Curtobacterium sp. MCBA15_004]WIB00840.1 hypothetical protein QOL15_03860 [Curtobacterium sp. MCBA15_012]
MPPSLAPDDGPALAATVGALHRIANFIAGQDHAEILELRNEAIRLAGAHLSAHKLADAAGIPIELVMSVLCG